MTEGATDKEKLFETLRRMAVFKGAEVNKERLQLYVEYLSKYDLAKVNIALKSLLDSHPGFPDIAHIVKLVDPPMSEDDRGNEMAGAIIDSIMSLGRYQIDEAKKRLGPIAWWVVERVGGWNTLCLMGTGELTSTRAQIRELSKAALKISHRNENDPRLLPHEKSGLKSLRDMFDKFKEEKLLT